MTCYELRVLLHYYAQPQDHPDMERNPPVWRTTIDRLIAEDLLAETSIMLRTIGRRDGDPTCYMITDRGNAYVEALMATPLPVLKWTMPSA